GIPAGRPTRPGDQSLPGRGRQRVRPCCGLRGHRPAYRARPGRRTVACGTTDIPDEPLSPAAPPAPDASYPGDYPSPAAHGDLDPFAYKPARVSLRDRLF